VSLTLRHVEGAASSFHAAYEAAVTRFGPPQDAGIRQEDLEDVFIRLTHEHDEQPNADQTKVNA